jgi:uncharacterized protein with von Willebrand factor type A (vWA) domain
MSAEGTRDSHAKSRSGKSSAPYRPHDEGWPPISENSLTGGVIAFGRLLKEHGFSVSTSSIMDALAGISRVGVENSQDFKTSLKATFMSRMEETAAFERLFNEFWLRSVVPSSAAETSQDQGDFGTEADGGSLTESYALLVETGTPDSRERQAWNDRPYEIYSPLESLKAKDFKEIPESEDPKMERLIREIVSPLIRRAGVRHRAASAGISLDLRKMLRKNVLHGGEFLELPRLRPKPRLKKFVFLCDVSGSMNPYLKFMLRFIKEIQEIRTGVETFVFATRLTRITPLVAHLPFVKAMKEIAATVLDWSGGTRIGACLHQFTSIYGASMLRPSTAILIHSDGWDRGDSALLEKEMAKIHRRAYRTLWINPLLGGLSYEPSCRGMRTALPHIDAFLPGHNIVGMETVAGTLRGLL